MKRQILLLSAVLLGAVMVGHWMRQSQPFALAADRVADPSELPAECRSNVTINSLDLTGHDGNSESFLVIWTPALSCLSAAGVEVKVTRRDGSTDLGTTFVENGNAATVKVKGFRSDNPAVKAQATVIVNGIQRGTGSSITTF